MFLNNFWLILREGFRASLIVSITNFVVVSRVGVTRVDRITIFYDEVI